MCCTDEEYRVGQSHHLCESRGSWLLRGLRAGFQFLAPPLATPCLVPPQADTLWPLPHGSPGTVLTRTAKNTRSSSLLSPQILPDLLTWPPRGIWWVRLPAGNRWLQTGVTKEALRKGLLTRCEWAGGGAPQGVEWYVELGPLSGQRDEGREQSLERRLRVEGAASWDRAGGNPAGGNRGPPSSPSSVLPVRIFTEGTGEAHSGQSLRTRAGQGGEGEGRVWRDKGTLRAHLALGHHALVPPIPVQASLLHRPLPFQCSCGCDVELPRIPHALGNGLIPAASQSYWRSPNGSRPLSWDPPHHPIIRSAPQSGQVHTN